jgi:hypothetical protein
MGRSRALLLCLPSLVVVTANVLAFELGLPGIYDALAPGDRAGLKDPLRAPRQRGSPAGPAPTPPLSETQKLAVERAPRPWRG